MRYKFKEILKHYAGLFPNSALIAAQSCSDLCDQFAKDFGEYIGEQIKYGNIKPSFKGDIIYWKLTREDRLINQHELFDLFQKQR